MKGDVPNVALRLMAMLPTRTHITTVRQRLTGGASGVPIVVDGETFVSMYAARRVYKVSQETIHKWIAQGKARWA